MTVATETRSNRSTAAPCGNCYALREDHYRTDSRGHFITACVNYVPAPSVTVVEARAPKVGDPCTGCLRPSDRLVAGKPRCCDDFAVPGCPGRIQLGCIECGALIEGSDQHAVAYCDGCRDEDDESGPNERRNRRRKVQCYVRVMVDAGVLDHAEDLDRAELWPVETWALAWGLVCATAKRDGQTATAPRHPASGKTRAQIVAQLRKRAAQRRAKVAS